MTTTSGSAPQITIPKLDAALVLPGGQITPPWHRLLIDMWRRLGGSTVSTVNAIYLALVGGAVEAFEASTSEVLGVVPIIGGKGPGAAIELHPGASPFVYSPNAPGSLVVSSGQVTLSRGTASLVGSLSGGSFFMVQGDSAQIVWFASPPQVYFFPAFTI